MEVFKLSTVSFALFIIIYMLRATMIETQRSSPCHKKCSYVEAFQQANCDDRGLEAVPMECNAASYLSLRYNQITTIEPGIFRGFPFLKYLILSDNNISHMEANTFIGAPQLKSIKLKRNNIEKFDRYALNGTEKRLRYIDLTSNSLRVIENGTFQLAPGLEVIDLDRNHLTRLTLGVFDDLDHLERLFLGMNELVDLHENIFKDLTSLVYLDLSNNSISSLSLDLFVHMNHLKTIDLSGNKLVDIGNVLTLSNIRLDLRWNHLRQLGDVSLEFLNNNVDTLFLEGNPWNCSCSVEPLRLWYQHLSVSNEKGVKVDNPVCSFPIELVNSKISSLNVPLCLPAKRKKDTSMNSPVYSPRPRPTTSGADDPLYPHVTEVSKKSTAITVIVIVSVGIVIIFSIIIYVVIRVLLSKKRSKDSDENVDSKGNEQEISAVMLEDGGNDHTPLPSKPDSELRKRSPFGVDLTPKHEIMKEEGSSQKWSHEIVDAPLLHKKPRGTPNGEISKKDSNRKSRKNLLPEFNQANPLEASKVLQYD